MRRPRLSIRLAILLVAVVALGLGSWIEVRHSLQLRQTYLVEAWMNGMMEKAARKNGNWTHQEWQAACREVDRRNREGEVFRSGRNVAFLFPSDHPELERRRADHYARLRQKYDRAARYPWLPVESDPPEPR